MSVGEGPTFRARTGFGHPCKINGCSGASDHGTVTIRESCELPQYPQ